VNFPNHLLEDVFESDQPEDAPVFVDDHRQARMARSKFHQKIAGRFRLGDNQHVADHGAKVEIRNGDRLAVRAVHQNPDHVLDVHKAENVVQRAFINREARALGGGEHAHRFFQARGHRKHMHIRTRNHQFAHLDLAELHCVLDEASFVCRQQAAVARLLNHHLKFFDRANSRVTVGCDHAHRTDNSLRDAIKQVDGPAKGVQEPVERPRYEERHALGARKADALGHQLAKDDLKNGE
jgi:hypothetical protein